ncbi:MAG: acyl-CoA dehydrogenase family protein, partial [Planctomycetes bacterium]|nr:acyl-CoA dehydrogenase family protein [Planctomycetota bacterium]
MDYLLTDEQKMMKEMVEKFSRDKIKPVAKHNDQSHEFPTELVSEMAELGLMGIPY